MKIYAAIVISCEPINLSSVEKDGLRHIVQQEFEMDNEIISEGGEYYVSKPAPEEYIKGPSPNFFGRGKSVSIVIMDWFKDMLSSLRYIPEYEKRKKDK